MSSSKHSPLNGYLKPVEDLGRDTREYVDIKVDEVKLKVTKGLSISLNHLLSMILLLFTLSIVLLAIAFGCILLLGQWLDSYAGGAFIMAGIFLIVTLVVFLLRKKLFVNGFVKMFAGIFFDNDKEEE